ncbi:MAG: sensor histidine kinase [Chitinophagaceae bacterium]|nr:sensor histidine kinase [Chitinophagaceae bacterium]
MDTHERKIYVAILIAAGILGIIVVYFIVTIIRNQRRHLKMQQANLLVEITTLENERKRIVSDLHDELGPLLSVVKFQISGLDPRDEEDLLQITKAKANLDDILQRIREICNHLMPQVLIRKGLLLAIKEFMADLDHKTSIKMEFTYEEAKIPPEAEVHLYRMIQEIVQNAIKHSFASQMRINVTSRDNKLVITAHDNGKGFSTDTVTKTSNGYGLKNILSRVDILHGEVYLASQPNKGTIYTIEIPNK